MIKEEKVIKDADDFEGYCCNLLDSICTELMDNPAFTRPVIEDDPVEEDIMFIWEPRATRLIEDIKSRLYKIADHYGWDIDISSCYYIES